MKDVAMERWVAAFGTYLGVGQLLPVGRQVEENARARARQRDSPDEEYHQDDVGKEGREVDHLAGGLDALAKAEEYYRPRQEEAGGQ